MRNLVVDAAVLAVYLVAANPALTGIAAHEWIGLALVVVVVAHVSASVLWAGDLARRAARPRSAHARLVLAVDALAAVAFAACVVSGVMVSSAVLPSLGLYATGYYFWDPLHAASAKALLALLLVHVVLHWPMVMSFVRRLAGKNSSGRVSDGSDTEAVSAEGGSET